MPISVKVIHSQKGIEQKLTLWHDTAEVWPEQYRKLFYENARRFTPQDTTRLKKSIRSQVSGNKVTVGWIAPYATRVNQGWHEVTKPIRGPNKRDGGYGTIMPGTYIHKTGSAGFMNRTIDQTRRDMIEWIRNRS